MRTRLDEIRDEFVDCVVAGVKDAPDFDHGTVSPETVAEILDRCFPAMAEAVVASSWPSQFDRVFPVVKREIAGDTINRQFEKVEEELHEVDVELQRLEQQCRDRYVNPRDFFTLALEAGDVVVASVTLLRMIADRMGTTPAEVLAAVHEKNAERGYYETPVTVTITNTLAPIEPKDELLAALLAEHDAFVLRVTHHGSRTSVHRHETAHHEADMIVRRSRRLADGFVR